MSDEESDSEIRSPEAGDFGHEEEGGGGKESAKEGVVAAHSSPDSEYDAGGEKRSIAYSIFQACTDYRQNIVNQADAYSLQATLLAVGGTICCLVLSVAIVFAIISGMQDGSKSNSEDNEAANKTSVKDDNKSGLFVLDPPHPDGSVGKEFDLYGSAAAFAEDLFLDEEASPGEPKNTSGLEDSYLNALDVI